MSDYNRLPPIDPAGDKQAQTEEKIFKKPEPLENTQKENTESTQVAELTPAEQKKQSLKEHLARCRVKSIATRKAKAEERKKNKKPRGRPKKVKENVEIQINEQETYNPTTHRIEEKEPVENQIVEPPKNKGNLKDIKEYHEKKEEKKQETRQHNFNQQQLDYNKLAELVAEKMKPPKQAQPVATPQPQLAPQMNNQKEITNFLQSYTQLVLQNDKVKRENEQKKQQQQNLQQATNNYYKKLPPMNLLKSDNPWDNCFNGNRR